MSDVVPASPSQPLAVAVSMTLGSDAPSIEGLFVFARDAELRVRSLRMVIEERSMNARGEDLIRHDALLRHQGHARVTSTRSEDPLSKDYDIWLGDSDTIQTYSARNNLSSTRARQPAVVGFDDPGLPPYARERPSVTALPAGSVADTFVHPHGLFRNVLTTGPIRVAGVRTVGGREAIVVQADHPRAAKVLVDRPDRSVEVSIDRATGFLLSLTEQISDRVTHHAEVTGLELDPDIPDSAFELHLSSSVRKLY